MLISPPGVPPSRIHWAFPLCDCPFPTTRCLMDGATQVQMPPFPLCAAPEPDCKQVDFHGICWFNELLPCREVCPLDPTAVMEHQCPQREWTEGRTPQCSCSSDGDRGHQHHQQAPRSSSTATSSHKRPPPEHNEVHEHINVLITFRSGNWFLQFVPKIRKKKNFSQCSFQGTRFWAESTSIIATSFQVHSLTLASD